MASQSKSPPDASVSNAPDSLPPIMKLFDDLLWKIFLLNADMKGDGPFNYDSSGKLDSRKLSLTIARRSSQVCKRWREITLGSPSLWGRIIDLSLFAESAEEWMDEVLRRSGQSFLHVKGRVTLDKAPSFISLIDVHWERIQILDVDIDGLHSTHIDEIWMKLGRPANHLQSFSLIFIPGDFTIDIYEMPNLFANDAPLLIDFHWSDFGLDFQSSWLSRLRILEIKRSPKYHIPQLLALFTQMPFLEELTLFWCIFHPEDFFLPQTAVNLPTLRSLNVLDELCPCIAFLESITLSPACSLDLLTSHNEGQGWHSNTAYSALRHYSENHFRAHPAKALYLEISARDLQFWDCTPLCAPVTPTFTLRGICEDELLSDIEYSDIISSFASSMFQNVRCFYFFILPTDLRALPSDPSLTRFLSGLQSVRVLVTTEETLEFLLGAREILPLVFPRLKNVLLMISQVPAHNDSNGIPEPLLSFFKWRRDSGVPIEGLSLMLCKGYIGDLGFLEELTGLVVGWRHPSGYRTYVCGSGSPETLMLSCAG